MDEKIIFGVDVGGTKIKMGAFDQDCHLLKKWSVRTQLDERGENVFGELNRQINGYLDEKGLTTDAVVSIGMGIPGSVQPDGFVRKSVNLGWENVDPVKKLSEHFPKAVIRVQNDANVAALGEFKAGGGKDYRSMVLVTLGTGVGGGIILNGQILAGMNGVAGEIGHLAIGPRRIGQCNCGAFGCVEQWASARGLAWEMKELLKEKRNHRSLLYDKEDVDAFAICEAANAGDAAAMECIWTCMGVLGKGLVTLTNLLDPELFVIGGGVSGGGQILVDAIAESYERNLFVTDKGADIKLAQLGNDAGMIGAAWLAHSGMETL